MKSNVKVSEPTEGTILAIAGGNYRIIVAGTATNNAYAVIEMLVPPGGGPPPHAHPDFEETFYVVEGAVEFKTEAGKSLVSQGGFVRIPLGGAIHCFKNVSDQFARLLCTVVPAGLDQIFEAIGVPTELGVFMPLPELSPERKAMLAALDKTYNQRTYPPDYLDTILQEAPENT